MTSNVPRIYPTLWCFFLFSGMQFLLLSMETLFFLQRPWSLTFGRLLALFKSSFHDLCISFDKCWGGLAQWSYAIEWWVKSREKLKRGEKNRNTTFRQKQELDFYGGILSSQIASTRIVGPWTYKRWMFDKWIMTKSHRIFPTSGELCT